MALDQEGYRLRAEWAVTRIEVDVPSVRYGWIGQRQAPAGKITKASGICEQVDHSVDELDVHSSTFDRCDDSDGSATARD